MPLLVLWDLDSTLIDNAGVSKEIYAEAFRIATGGAANDPARTEGRTDPDIMADMLRRNAVAPMPWPQLASALEQAGRSRAPRLLTRGRLLPGVLVLVETLARQAGTVQTVVSGNIRANAVAKLRPFELLPWFDLEVGAFGSDNSIRAELVKAARTRATAKYALPAATKTVVIGDTPRDVEAAHGAGCSVLAVATGIHSVDQLRSAGADHVATDLSDTDAVLGLLTEDSHQGTHWFPS